MRRSRAVAACAAVFASVAALAGCRPAAAPPGGADADSAFAPAHFHPPAGPPGRPRVDAFFAPGGTSATAWLPDGTFWNGDVELAFTDASGAALAFEDRARGLHRELPAAVRDAGPVIVRAFVPWSGSDRDTAAWTRLLVVVAGHDSAGAARFDLVVRAAGEGGRPLHPRAAPADSFTWSVDGDRILRDGRTVAIVRRALAETLVRPLLERPARTTALARTPVFTVEGGRDAGPRLLLDLWIAPVGGAAARAEPPDARSTFAASFERTSAAWRAELAKGTAIVHPDPRLDAALANATRLLVGNRERRPDGLHLLGSPFQYRDLYLRDGARVVRALLLLGRNDLAGEALGSLFAFQWPGGAFLSQRGQLDGTGQALWALGEFAAFGGDSTVVAGLLEPALRGARWVALQRATATLRGGPAAGLLPYADPRDNELVRAHLFGNDAWAIAGLEAIVPVLRRHGRAAAADSLVAEAAAHRTTLLAAWDRAARARGRPLPPALEGGGRDWGNVSAAWPCGVIAADDARAVALDAWLRAHASNEGLLVYGGRDSLHHYLGFDRTQAALRRGDRATVARDLDAILARTQPDGSGHEIVHVTGAFGENLPPHGTFAAMFVDLVRCSIVHESGDSLVLFAGAATWPAPLAAPALPTHFGPLALATRADSAGNAFVLDVGLPAAARMTAPAGRTIRAVRREGGGAPASFAGDRVVLPAGAATWIVEFDPTTAGGSR